MKSLVWGVRWRWGFLLFWGIALVQAGFSQSSFSRGESFFLDNKPQEALPYLEAAVAENPGTLRAAIYLGISYQQLDRTDEAIAVYRRVLPGAGKDTAAVAYNLGNAYYTKGNASLAEQYYSQAIDADPVYASAYLNRANTKVGRGALREALVDYELYLSLEPVSAKKPQIESLLELIRGELAAEERRRIQEEVEAERRQRLLEEVAASLQSAAEETQGLSSGSEEVLGYEGEFELE
ncbi:MAG: tetratricopeptide repeat protein [Treponema sp.]|nr:tetratricopeptide repeat protein [Treponema sp.]